MVTDLGSCCARAVPARSWSKTNTEVTTNHRGFHRAFIASPPVEAVQSNLPRCLVSTCMPRLEFMDYSGGPFVSSQCYEQSASRFQPRASPRASFSVPARRAELGLFSPQLLGRDASALRHCFKLCPGDLRIADPRSEAAVGSCRDVFPADDLGVAHQPVGNRLRMLDDIGGMADDAGHEDFSFGQFHVLPNPPLVLVSRIGGFDGNGIGAHFQDQIDDIS